ncbi:hint-domain-containing protein [Sarocladium implicatum]|nr:hint-domain-containing protein [Sarocladium implicatum]
MDKSPDRGEKDLPLRLKDGAPPAYDEHRVQIHPVPSRGSVIVKVEPPQQPSTEIDHVPCDIVLVIDVSGSMQESAPVPGDAGEDTGLSILDLVKHATKTIIHTCNSSDRVGIVKFSNDAVTVLPLTEMTPKNQKMAQEKVEGLHTEAATNLWGGIRCGLDLFEKSSNNVPALLVLTDGVPNHMCPVQGYVPKLMTMMPLPATIHTFGFGYHLRSGLLKAIAETGDGNYGFIPDAGMIGTVFNNAVANLQSTYATRATLRLSYPASMELQEAAGSRADASDVPESSGGLKQLTIPLGNLQYGQSRDIYLKVDNLADVKTTMLSANLQYRTAVTEPSKVGPPTAVFDTSADVTIPGRLSEAEIAFHESRAQLCASILSMFELVGKYERVKGSVTLGQKQDTLASLVAQIRAKDFKKADKDNEALMEDICGEDPAGQVSLAVSNEAYFERWGRHYLLSFVNAHSRQMCNSFKDPGPQRYGVNSPLFKRCLAHLDDQFDKLPPPKPSRQVHDRRTGRRGFLSASSISMSGYNRSSAPCFAGSTSVMLASGRTVRMKRVRRGMQVKTPLGPRKVAFVLKTPVDEEALCKIGPLLVTPWHPISADGGKTWEFPAHVEGSRPVKYTGAIYSVMLQRDAQTASHAIQVEDSWGVTLGHGITTESEDDIRGHEFWGDWNRLGKEVLRLGVSRTGVAFGNGVQRDEVTGLVKALK